MWKMHTNQLYKLATQQKHLLCQALWFYWLFHFNFTIQSALMNFKTREIQCVQLQYDY